MAVDNKWIYNIFIQLPAIDIKKIVFVKNSGKNFCKKDLAKISTLVGNILEIDAPANRGKHK